jgi:replicative DNA helicase
MSNFDEDLWGPEEHDWRQGDGGQVIDLSERRAERGIPSPAPVGSPTPTPPAGGSPVRGLGATPFVAGHGYARRFPTETLPERMRGYCHDLAVRKQVPVDLVALTMIGMLGAVAGPRILIRRDLDWVQPTNIYACCGLPSGAGKSPTVEELRRGARRALKRLAERQTARTGEEIATLLTESEGLYRRANHIQTPIDEREDLRVQAKAKEALAEQLRSEPPTTPQIMFDGDISVEALAVKMATNGGAGAIVDDEGTFLRVLGGMYNGGRTGNLGLVLVGYDCRSYAPGRITRTAQPIDRAALSLVISPQPGIIAEMLRDQAMVDAGVINRFLVSIPGDLVGQREDRPATYYRDLPTSRPDRAGRDWWAGLLASIVEYDVIDPDRPDEDAAVIELTRAAFKRHREYEREFEARMHPATGDLLSAAAWGSKHLGRVMRVAALLHLAAGFTSDDELSESVMEDAIAIGEWSIEHFLAAGSASGLSEDAGRIKEFVDNTEFGHALRSEINRKVFANKAPKAAMTRWIGELVATGAYSLEQVPTRGRPGWAVCRAGSRPPVGGSDAV